MSTTAEKIATQFATVKTLEDGRSLRDVLRSSAVRAIRQEDADGYDPGDEPTKFIFSDDSAIVTAGDGFDVALDPSPSGCFCWSGAGHAPDCDV